MQQNANIQQNIFNTFGHMRQTVTQLTPMQEPVVKTQTGGGQRASGKKGRPKKKGKEVIVVIDETEAPPTWWTPEEEHVLADA